MGEPDSSGIGRGGPDRDPRLSWFASGGRYDKAKPEPAMAVALEAVTDPGGRPPGAAADDEVIGMLGRWQAIEAHAHARMLAVIREVIRRRARAPRGEHRPGTGHSTASGALYPGDLPAQWDIGVAHEVAAELRVSWQAAEPLAHLAWELEARLPEIGRLLDEGVLTALKARIVVDEFSVLADDKIAQAQQLLLEEDLAAADLTPGRLRRACQRIVDTVDPEGQRKRREQVEREHARVDFFRAHGGDVAMFARGLPADEALIAKANIQQRAREYRKCLVCPDAGMDLLRVLAMVDLINGRSLDWRIARYHAEKDVDDARQAADERAADAEASAKLGTRPPGTRPPAPGYQDDPDTGWDGPGDDPGAGRDNPGDREPGLPALSHLLLPLATLLDLAERPGEAPGFGSVDPALVRRLASAAAGSPRTRYCLTLTDSHGHAIGHGCATLIRDDKTRLARDGETSTRPAGSRDGPAVGRDPAPDSWDLVPDRTRPGPPGGYGRWLLTVPGGHRYRLDVHPVPTYDCDHRLATASYRPGALLRHLVQVRDGECSFTGCSCPAAQCDFEHAKPYDQGGATCACNAGARSRRCHRVKQSEGWTVTQPRPGWHQWRAPSGRAYAKGPKRYTA